MNDRKRLNSKILRVNLVEHSGPLCMCDWWGWSFAQGSRATPRLMVWKDYSEKLLLCQCQVCASDNAELDDASFMLLSYEGYEFHNVKSSVWHTSTFFPLLLVKFRKKDVLKAEITPHHKSFVYQTKEDSYIQLCRVKCNSKLKDYFFILMLKMLS